MDRPYLSDPYSSYRHKAGAIPAVTRIVLSEVPQSPYRNLAACDDGPLKIEDIIGAEIVIKTLPDQFPGFLA
jgi:hypothetical protein